MATKTIYVKDEDLIIFEKALELGGDSLSGVIVEALRRYIDAEEAKAKGFQEIIILEGFPMEVKLADGFHKVRFIGKLLGEASDEEIENSRHI